jgi:C_GCAxxG_C_C family probable redox protein
MSEKSEAALHLFQHGRFNCAQSVLAVFCETYGLDKETAFKISSGLGSGIRCGELCGAVSGAAQVIGLKYGQSEAGDLQAKENCYAKTLEFVTKFKKVHGSIVCRELLGHDIWTNVTEETKKLAQELHSTVCPKLIESAVKILEETNY